MLRRRSVLISIGVVMVAALILAPSVIEVRRLRSQVLLKFERCTSITGAILGMDVFVNGLRVGTVGNGSSGSFYFTPKSDGNNVVYAELVTLVGPSNKSPEIPFYATQGAVVSARCEFTAWQMAIFPDIKLDVFSEKEGVPIVDTAELPTEAQRANPNDRADWYSWDAIGAIAGIGSLFIALVGFMCRLSRKAPN